MPDWATFAVATVALTLLLLYVTRRSRRTLERVRIVDSQSDIAVATGSDADSGSRIDIATGPAASDDSSAASDDGSAANDTGYDSATIDDGHVPTDPATIDDHGPTDEQPTAERPTDEQPTAERPTSRNRDEPVLTTTLLLINAAVSQALALAVLAALAWWTAVPASAFGVSGEHAVLGSSAVPSLRAPDPATAIGLGVIAGVVLYVGNEVVAGLGARFGASVPDRLRKAMAPGNAHEWILLFGVVLPVIAVFEEALFRGALIGAFAVGFAVDPWLLAVGSSVAFGLGHGAQGRIGIAVTGLLGLVLAALFVVSGSLLLVIVAHYVINASEFAIREGLDLDPVSTAG